MKIAFLSANLGRYDKPHGFLPPHLPEGWTCERFHYTDDNFPPRFLAMTSRLQCAIPKMFGWELHPGFDAYLWVDASCQLKELSVPLWIEQLGSAEMVLFQHPDRKTIKEEYEFIKARLARPGEKYLTSRYAGEWLDAQYAAVTPPWYHDRTLYASTAFLYRPTHRVQQMMKDWWFHKSRYLLHDQLALPYVLADHRVHVNVLPDKYTDCPYLTYVRNRK